MNALRKFILLCFCILDALFIVQAQEVDVNNLRRDAVAGDVNAMLELSKVYKQQGNNELYLKWLNKAAEGGSQEAIKLKAEVDLDNIEDPVDYFRTVYNLVQQGDINAMLRLAELYDFGSGAVSKNDEEALLWYRKALSADKDMFYKKINFRSDLVRSIITEEANSGDIKCMLLLGNYYDTGYSVSSENREKAQKWYKMAADKGDPEAKNKYNEILAQKKHEKEQAKKEKDDYQATLKNFAGVWVHRNNKIQFKFDLKGQVWFRTRTSIRHYWSNWTVISAVYVGSNRYKIYYPGGTDVFEVSGNRMRSIYGDYDYENYKQ